MNGGHVACAPLPTSRHHVYHPSFRGARSANPESRDPGFDAAHRPGMTALPSPIPSVNRRHLNLRQFDAVDAAHVERDHVAAVGLGAAGEHVDAAIDAELMADG